MQGIRGLLSNLYHSTLGKWIYPIKLSIYRCTLPSKIKKIRKKESIKVLFVTSGIRQWKSFALFQAMYNHSKFEPIVGVFYSDKYPNDKKDLIDFLLSKGYNYVDLDIIPQGIKAINPDIIFYNSPYSTNKKNLDFDKNLRYVLCGVDYTIHITKLIQHLDHPWYDFCWQFYVEHEDVAKEKKAVLGYKANNIFVTGVPRQDELLHPSVDLSDPWKDKSEKKRIIYAPHHSIRGTNDRGIECATFLDYYDFIFELSQKYRDKITIAFKPHPFLYIKLLEIWGKERTDLYYNKWASQDNTQFENGEYLGLFQYSDAIIHDSASFIIEYLYMNNPSMYLFSETNQTKDMLDYVQEGLNCYEQGRSKEDIESFIIRIINDKDIKQQQRTDYIKKQLLPPNGKTACENIMNAILKG